MKIRALVSRSLVGLLVTLPALLPAGCGGESEVTAPADEPNIGPGGPPGGSPAKGAAKSPAPATKGTPPAK
jgi:hypothetical protein